MSKVNWNYIIKSIILISLSFILYEFVSSGYILNYVHERTVSYIKVSIIFMLLISFVLLINFKNNLEIRRSNKGLTIYLIPIFLFSSILLFSFQKDTINYNKSVDSNILVVDEKNFNDFILNLEDKLKYEDGKSVKITGFINNKKGFNELYIARELMACCAADLSLLEVECYSDDNIDIDINKWVEVNGTIKTIKDKKIIIVESIVEINKPQNEYVHVHS